MGSNPIL
jgi:hypothetical protein